MLYYVPRKELTQLARRKQIRKESLQDFPYGLEVEVSKEEYSLVQQEYGFSPPMSPTEIWRAFRGFWLHSNQAVSISGLINANQLETYSRQISRALEYSNVELHSVEGSQQGTAEGPAPTQAERSGLWQERMDAILRQTRPKHANSERPLNQQVWNHVPMSPGLSAGVVFSSAQSTRLRG